LRKAGLRPRIVEDESAEMLTAELSAAEPSNFRRFGRLVKAPTVNRIHQSLKHLEDHIIAVAWGWGDPAQVAILIHKWIRVDVNATAKTKRLLAG